MADFILDSSPLQTFNSIHVKGFLEIPCQGTLETYGELFGSSGTEHLSEIFSSNGELLGEFGRGYIHKAVPFSTIGSNYGSFNKILLGFFVSVSQLFGNIRLDVTATPIGTVGSLTGKLVKETINLGLLETDSQIICSQLLFVPFNQQSFILTNGAHFTVSSEIGCFDISVKRPNEPVLTSLDELLAEQCITGSGTIYWAQLRSTSQLLGTFLREHFGEEALDSIGEISAHVYAEQSQLITAFPLETVSTLAVSAGVKNLPAGYVMHLTDIITLTKPLDLIKLNPRRDTQCL